MATGFRAGDHVGPWIRLIKPAAKSGGRRAPANRHHFFKLLRKCGFTKTGFTKTA